MYSEAEQGRTSETALITILCSHFEAGIFTLIPIFTGNLLIDNDGGAAKNAEKLRGTNNTKSQFSLKELDWFSQNAYNCSINGCENWESQQIISITQSCLKVPTLTLLCITASN